MYEAKVSFGTAVAIVFVLWLITFLGALFIDSAAVGSSDSQIVRAVVTQSYYEPDTHAWHVMASYEGMTDYEVYYADPKMNFGDKVDAVVVQSMVFHNPSLHLVKQ